MPESSPRFVEAHKKHISIISQPRSFFDALLGPWASPSNTMNHDAMNSVNKARTIRLESWLKARIDIDQHWLELQFLALALSTGIIDAVAFPKYHCCMSQCDVSRFRTWAFRVCKWLTDLRSYLKPNRQYRPLCRLCALTLRHATRDQLSGADTSSCCQPWVLLHRRIHSCPNLRPSGHQILPLVAPPHKPHPNLHGLARCAPQPPLQRLRRPKQRQRYWAHSLLYWPPRTRIWRTGLDEPSTKLAGDTNNPSHCCVCRSFRRPSILRLAHCEPRSESKSSLPLDLSRG